MFHFKRQIVDALQFRLVNLCPAAEQAEGFHHVSQLKPSTRRDFHREVLGRSLWLADRITPRGHFLLLQIRRRLPGQHRHRHGAAGAEIRPHYPRRQRADGPLHPRTVGARGRRG